MLMSRGVIQSQAMKSTPPLNILAIETSCDETAAAVIKDGQHILSSVIASQAEIHSQYGGVVPEVAARSHIEVVIPVIEQALSEAKLEWEQIDAIAVTRGPGLIGSLLIGVMSAKTLALHKNKPLIGVNHIWSHAFAAFLNPEGSTPQFPFLALTVSGGHSTLSIYQEDLSRKVIGETLDDAVGEAFDKVAKLLGLPYPGGPAISALAEQGNDNAYKFPIANLGADHSFDFSFSGLKTAVLRQVIDIASHSEPNLESSKQSLTPVHNDTTGSLPKTYALPKQAVADIAASFQRSAVQALVAKTQKAFVQFKPQSLVVGGGVACNQLLRTEIKSLIPQAIFVPPVLCTDNAAMIGALAYKMAERNIYTDPLRLSADSSLEEL